MQDRTEAKFFLQRYALRSTTYLSFVLQIKKYEQNKREQTTKQIRSHSYSISTS